MDNLQQQLDISASMLESLNKMAGAYSNITSTIESQSSTITDAIDSIKDASKKTSSALSQASSMHERIASSISLNVEKQLLKVNKYAMICQE